MNTREQVIAWRAQAPWQDDAQVEQDLFLTRAMVAIFSDEFLSGQVAMRGGTALHKVHLAPAARCSEDIDLVAVGNRPQEHLRKALHRVLAPLLGNPRQSAWDTVQLAVRNAARPSRVLRLAFEFTPVLPPRDRRALKVEVDVTERRSFYPVLALPFGPHAGIADEAVTLRSYDLHEMLATKLRALLQRDQGRDLFDLWWACTGRDRDAALPAVDPDRVIAAFRHYLRAEGSSVDAEAFARELDRKTRDAGFRSDMALLLQADLPPYDVDEAARVVKGTLRSRL
ncbi:MAG: nucleotidyl transferase AbiEii/AbiGii toxin family protein [Burkholderiales bacterium]